VVEAATVVGVVVRMSSDNGPKLPMVILRAAQSLADAALVANSAVEGDQATRSTLARGHHHAAARRDLVSLTTTGSCD
jgi:hypothetical protein